ncbi:MAG: nucleoside triphosphate pyrophosphohydrolase [Pseudomonadota bacterium]
MYTLDDLLRIMERLRDPQHGCPWDVEQTFESIIPSTIEECYELAAAIQDGDFAHVADELGDVLFQVIFYTQLGKEQELFDFSSVVDGLSTKLIRRHPHVFAHGKIEGIVGTQSDSGSSNQAAPIADAPAVKRQWEKIKADERRERAQQGALDDVPVALPALPRAQKLQKRAARVGFDWSAAAPVFAKLDEEIAELVAASESGSPGDVEDELGDVLFTVVNLARHLGVNAEQAMRRANHKFESRFKKMEAEAAEGSEALSDLSPAQLEALWSAAKDRLDHSRADQAAATIEHDPASHFDTRSEPDSDIAREAPPVS